MNKSIIIADVAQIIYEKEVEYGKKIIQEAWDSVHDDLLEGYYNRKSGEENVNGSPLRDEGYNPEDYGFKLQPNKIDKEWRDPLVEDLLNNYDWNDNNNFIDKLWEEQPQLGRLINEEFNSYYMINMKEFREYQKQLRKEYGIEEDE